MKTYKRSTQDKMNRSFLRKGSKYYTNGEKNIVLYVGMEVPEGFYPGLTRSEEWKKKHSDFFKEYNKKHRKGKHWVMRGPYRVWEK